jgi:hypothetical protein
VLCPAAAASVRRLLACIHMAVCTAIPAECIAIPAAAGHLAVEDLAVSAAVVRTAAWAAIGKNKLDRGAHGKDGRKSVESLFVDLALPCSLGFRPYESLTTEYAESAETQLLVHALCTQRAVTFYSSSSRSRASTL